MGAMRATPFLRRVLLVGSLAFTTALSAQSVIFWAQNGNDRVLRADGNGASVTDLTPTLSNPWGVAYDGTHVYFSEDNAGKLWRMDPDGNNRTEIANGLSMPRDVAVSSTNLYWVNISGGVFRSNLDGTGVTTLTTVAGSPFLQGVDVTDNYLYWTNATAHTIQRSNLDGTNVVTLIDSIDLVGAPSGLFVTDTAIYFTQQYHGVYRANLDGSGLTQLVTGSSDYRFIDGQVLAVPEPSTYALLAGGLALGLAAWRRRGGV